MIDIRDPGSPTFAGCFADPATGRRKTGYSHDAQCVVYHGPDSEYEGRELCFGSNETALSIADVTDKANPAPISVADYPNVGYAHQGWLTDDHQFFFLDDELDEVNGLVENTRTMVWDVSDLDDPILVAEYFGPTKATDHNLYVKGDRMYQSNNRSGLRVIDVSDPANPTEVGHFDTTPWSQDEAGFDGTWSVYPFFESGVVLLSSRLEGLFLVRPRARLVP
jgi:choice-of-anchor B domain-containing protein